MDGGIEPEISNSKIQRTRNLFINANPLGKHRKAFHNFPQPRAWLSRLSTVANRLCVSTSSVCSPRFRNSTVTSVGLPSNFIVLLLGFLLRQCCYQPTKSPLANRFWQKPIMNQTISPMFPSETRARIENPMRRMVEDVRKSWAAKNRTAKQHNTGRISA